MSLKQEIEYKFLVHVDLLPTLPLGVRMAQGYLGYEPTIRVRTEDWPDGRRAFLTIKGPGLFGRDEYEYPIPVDEAESLLGLSQGSVIRKTRYRLAAGDDLWWELDVFEGDNRGLVVAELEVPDPNTPVPSVNWLGENVTSNSAYKNAALARRPFQSWD